MSESDKPANQNDADQSSKRSSSQGDSPAKMLPKDVSPEDASWKDRTERKAASGKAEDHIEELLDEASEMSFPASDPIAVSSSTKLVKDKDGKLHPAPETPKKQP